MDCFAEFQKLARSSSSVLSFSLVLIVGCGSSGSIISRTGPSGVDASAAGGLGGSDGGASGAGGGAAGGTGGICVGAVGTGGAMTINFFVDRLIVGTGPVTQARG